MHQCSNASLVCLTNLLFFGAPVHFRQVTHEVNKSRHSFPFGPPPLPPSSFVPCARHHCASPGRRPLSCTTIHHQQRRRVTQENKKRKRGRPANRVGKAKNSPRQKGAIGNDLRDKKAKQSSRQRDPSRPRMSGPRTHAHWNRGPGRGLIDVCNRRLEPASRQKDAVARYAPCRPPLHPPSQPSGAEQTAKMGVVWYGYGESGGGWPLLPPQDCISASGAHQCIVVGPCPAWQTCSFSPAARPFRRKLPFRLRLVVRATCRAFLALAGHISHQPRSRVNPLFLSLFCCSNLICSSTVVKLGSGRRPFAHRPLSHGRCGLPDSATQASSFFSFSWPARL